MSRYFKLKYIIRQCFKISIDKSALYYVDWLILPGAVVEDRKRNLSTPRRRKRTKESPKEVGVFRQTVDKYLKNFRYIEVVKH